MLLDNEQRQYERISTERPVTLDSDQVHSHAKMIDLSIRGLGLISQTPISEGDSIQLGFRLPTTGESEIKVSGIAVHTQQVRREFLVGIEFKNLQHGIEKVIHEYIQFHHRLD